LCTPDLAFIFKYIQHIGGEGLCAPDLMCI
jgi:hypothetical protein